MAPPSGTALAAALLSAALVIPLLALVNQPAARVHFPGALFVALWLLPTAFLLVAIPATRSLRAGAVPGPLALLSRAAAMSFLAFAWLSLFLDQLPCFLGVPNCD